MEALCLAGLQFNGRLVPEGRQTDRRDPNIVCVGSGNWGRARAGTKRREGRRAEEQKSESVIRILAMVWLSSFGSGFSIS